MTFRSPSLVSRGQKQNRDSRHVMGGTSNIQRGGGGQGLIAASLSSPPRPAPSPPPPVKSPLNMDVNPEHSESLPTRRGS